MSDAMSIGGAVLPSEDSLLVETSVPHTETAPQAPNGFALLGLAPELLQAVEELGFTQPTAVQQATIPFALGQGESGRSGGSGYADLMVSSQTGSGKTAAFLLPVLHTLLQLQVDAAKAEKEAFDKAAAEAAERGEAVPKRPRRKNPTDPRHFKAAVPGALVVCPTRELAQQVANDAIDLVRHCRGLRIANIVGGMPYQMQVAKLQNAHLVVATPGRLLDLERAGQIKLNEVQFLVMDEADRMLDLGFSDDLAEINRLTQQRRQTMMFSATFAPRIQQLALRVMHDNGAHVKKVEIATPQEKHANITQSLYWADTPEHKRALLDHWLRDASINQAIVFACTQIECDNLANDLQQANFSAVALHGALSQGMRNRRLSALRDGRVQILVATDVAARGIDVPTITHVFNFGLPMKAEDYTHRIGRTGRAGRDGLAVTFAEFRDRRRIADIEHHTQQPLKAATVEGMEPKGRFPSSFFNQERGDGRRGGAGGRPQGGRFNNRSEGRFDGRSERRFDGRPDRFEPRSGDRHPSENRFGARPPARGDDRGFDRSGGRSDGPRFEGRGGFGHGPAHHSDRRPAERHDFDQAPRASERGGPRGDNRGGDVWRTDGGRAGGFAGFGRADKVPGRNGGSNAADWAPRSDRRNDARADRHSDHRANHAPSGGRGFEAPAGPRRRSTGR